MALSAVDKPHNLSAESILLIKNHPFQNTNALAFYKAGPRLCRNLTAILPQLPAYEAALDLETGKGKSTQHTHPAPTTRPLMNNWVTEEALEPTGWVARATQLESTVREL